ncbi:pilus assembly protein [Roseibium hamelinense]|nr:pilus assembly protein [Roseibium hamelinense]
MHKWTSNIGFRPGRHVLLAAAMAVVAGCQSNTSQTELLAANDYRLRHPIVITEQPQTLDLPVGSHTRSLNRDLKDAVAQFGAESVHHGNGRVDMQVPSGAANEAAVHEVSKQVRAALKRGGARSVTTRSYPVGDAKADAPIRLSYPRLKASAGPCGEWPKNIGGSVNQNVDYENFGCATQANLAAMVSNPADLLTPRASAPADQNRRATVYEKYRKGESTAAEFTEGVGAEVAE